MVPIIPPPLEELISIPPGSNSPQGARPYRRPPTMLIPIAYPDSPLFPPLPTASGTQPQVTRCKKISGGPCLSR